MIIATEQEADWEGLCCQVSRVLEVSDATINHVYCTKTCGNHSASLNNWKNTGTLWQLGSPYHSCWELTSTLYFYSQSSIREKKLKCTTNLKQPKCKCNGVFLQLFLTWYFRQTKGKLTFTSRSKRETSRLKIWARSYTFALGRSWTTKDRKSMF